MRQHYQNPACTFCHKSPITRSTLRAVCEAAIPFFTLSFLVAVARVMVILRISLSVDTTFMPYTRTTPFSYFRGHRPFADMVIFIKLQYVWMQRWIYWHFFSFKMISSSSYSAAVARCFIWFWMNIAVATLLIYKCDTTRAFSTMPPIRVYCFHKLPPMRVLLSLVRLSFTSCFVHVQPFLCARWFSIWSKFYTFSYTTLATEIFSILFFLWTNPSGIRLLFLHTYEQE